ncbi:hypothetical protein ACIHDR_49460 [Nocardia sp. NPDC052278]|uniref:hypothetical protein n=1 Tax=unclassified Nocardia TaxID=2637762 RepID=UPI0036AF8673
MTVEKVVPDVETDKKIIVARVVSSREYPHWSEIIDQLLERAGLAGYAPSSRPPFTVDLAELTNNLPGKAEIRVYARSGTPDKYDVRDALEELLSPKVRAFLDRIIDNEVVAERVESNSSAIDVDAVVAEWGDSDDPLPEAGSDDIEAFRRELVATVLRYGEEQHLCDLLEKKIAVLGLRDYLPPSSKDVTLDIPGFGLATVDVSLTRAGAIRQSELRRAVADFIANSLAERGDLAALATTA